MKASGTTVTEVHGDGPIVACYLLGHTGSIDRFPNAGHYARYNGTALSPRRPPRSIDTD